MCCKNGDRATTSESGNTPDTVQNVFKQPELERRSVMARLKDKNVFKVDPKVFYSVF